MTTANDLIGIAIYMGVAAAILSAVQLSCTRLFLEIGAKTQLSIDALAPRVRWRTGRKVQAPASRSSASPLTP